MTSSTCKLEASGRAPGKRGHVSILLSIGEVVHAAALREGQSLVVGRSKPAQLLVADSSLSRAHARLSMRHQEVWLDDLDSTNGCLVNGMRCRRVQLFEGDVVLLGAVEMRLCGLAARQAEPTLAPPTAREAHDSDAVVIASPSMVRLREVTARAARACLPVLVCGETGSGKELVATAIHALSPRSQGPFRVVNCAAIPQHLVEGLLLGHERGAFTGADRRTPGIFEQAHGGTVFLDEVAELSLQAQASLLRLLEQRRLTRLGGTQEVEVDVRIVAATHRDLSEMVEQRLFREDLMYRLDALTLLVPPLRERKEEILPLARLFLTRARSAWSASARGFSADVERALLGYAWPGNVRQLKNAVERAAVLCQEEQIMLADLPPGLFPAPAPGEPAEHEQLPSEQALPSRVRAFEIRCITNALREANGNQARAARILGMPRKTLTTKIQVYRLQSGD